MFLHVFIDLHQRAKVIVASRRSLFHFQPKMAEQTDKHEEKNGLDSPSKSEERTEDFKFPMDVSLMTLKESMLAQLRKPNTLTI